MKAKNAGISLMIASIYWIIAELYRLYERTAGESSSYYNKHPGLNLSYSLQIIVPIALLILAIYLISKKPD